MLYADKTVDEYLWDQCSRSLLEELVLGGNIYWKTVGDFVKKKADVKLKDLSKKQREWLVNIKHALIDEASKDW